MLVFSKERYFISCNGVFPEWQVRVEQQGREHFNLTHDKQRNIYAVFNLIRLQMHSREKRLAMGLNPCQPKPLHANTPIKLSFQVHKACNPVILVNHDESCFRELVHQAARQIMVTQFPDCRISGITVNFTVKHGTDRIA